jgi:hypothetical protein
VTKRRLIGSAPRITAACLALALCISLAAGCGSEDISPDTVAEAADTTIGAGGSRVSLQTSFTTPDGQRVPVNGKGVMDAKGERGLLDMNLAPVLAAAGERAKEGEAVIRSLFLGYEIYLGGPLLEKELPGKKKWIKIDIREVTRKLGLEELLQLNQNNPRKTLDYLRAAGSVEEIGTENVRGVPTTHYKAVVDLSRYAEALPPEKRTEAQADIRRAKELFGGTDRISFEVWVDEKKLVRRIKDSYSFPANGQGRVRIQETLEFFDFGIPVSLEAPPKSQVADVTELAAREAKKERSTQ